MHPLEQISFFRLFSKLVTIRRPSGVEVVLDPRWPLVWMPFCWHASLGTIVYKSHFKRIHYLRKK